MPIACDANLFSVQGMKHFQLVFCFLTLCFLCNTQQCPACLRCLPTACVYTVNFNKYKLLLKRVKTGYFMSHCSCSTDGSKIYFILFYKLHCSHFPSIP